MTNEEIDQAIARILSGAAHQIASMVTRARSEERERCALACETYADRCVGSEGDGAQGCASEIRALQP